METLNSKLKKGSDNQTKKESPYSMSRHNAYPAVVQLLDHRCETPGNYTRTKITLQQCFMYPGYEVLVPQIVFQADITSVLLCRFAGNSPQNPLAWKALSCNSWCFHHRKNLGLENFVQCCTRFGFLDFYRTLQDCCEEASGKSFEAFDVLGVPGSFSKFRGRCLLPL